MNVTLYQYPACGTCRKAAKWLAARGVAFESVDIVGNPPSAQTLRQAQQRAGVPVRKLFNTSGQSYRQGGWKDRLATMSDDEAFAALAADGKLIKRPLVFAGDRALVGFDEAVWAEVFGG